MLPWFKPPGSTTAAPTPNFKPKTIANTSTNNSFPDLIRTNAATIVISYRDGTSHVNSDGAIKVRRSTDGGKTWGSGITVADSADDDRNASLVYSSGGDRIVAFHARYDSSTAKGIYRSSSTDDGQSWTTPSESTVWSNAKTPFGGGTETSNGLMTMGVSDGGGIVEAAFSTDNGQSFGNLTTVADSTNISGLTLTEPVAVTDPTDNSRVLVYGRDNNDGDSYAVTSTDGGSSWSSITQFSVGAETAPWDLDTYGSDGVLLTIGSRNPSAGEGKTIRSYTASFDTLFNDPTAIENETPTIIAPSTTQLGNANSANFGYAHGLTHPNDTVADSLIAWYDPHPRSGEKNPNLQVATQSAAYDPTVRNGLELWWPITNYSGSIVHDYADGFGDDAIANGSISGATFSTDSKVASHSISIDSADSDHVDAGGAKPSGSFSVVLWAKATAENDYHIIFSTTDGSISSSDRNGIILQKDNNDKLRTYNRNSGTLEFDINSASSMAGAWAHCAVTWDGSTAELYLDGASEGTGSSPSFSHDLPARLGNNPNQTSGPQYDGLVDGVRIYNRALSSSEISDIYNQEV